jgi:hypothetical protein
VALSKALVKDAWPSSVLYNVQVSQFPKTERFLRLLPFYIMRRLLKNHLDCSPREPNNGRKTKRRFNCCLKPSLSCRICRGNVGTCKKRRESKYPPEGYPDPSSEVQVFPALVAVSSSKVQFSMQASRVTLAATLAAPTILYLLSALAVTVNLIPGNRDERYDS